MIIIYLAFLGLALGSFVNALVWRVHRQATKKSKVKSLKSKVSKTKTTSSSGSNKYSILKGRSMCPHCQHTLSALDLLPVLSWLLLRNKCRYCSKPIGWQYPLVELATGLLFILSYVYWPLGWDMVGVVNFVAWLVVLVGFMALLVYDLRWMLLPNRLMYPLLAIGLVLALFNLASASSVSELIATIASVAVGGGIFYAIFLVSDGRWIGGGDVKLGALIGLILTSPYLAFLVLLTASTLGTLVILPGMLLKKLTATSRIPFGPFLIVAAIVVQLFGRSLIEWYKRVVLLQG